MLDQPVRDYMKLSYKQEAEAKGKATSPGVFHQVIVAYTSEGVG